jgi:ketosteroid isomerase-like protein
MRMSRSIPAALVLVFVLAIVGNVQGADVDQDTLRHLKEVLWPRAYAEQDGKLLDAILADEFQMVDADGHWSSKRDELNYITRQKPTHDSFVFTIKRLEVFENGTAIVAGQGTIEGKDKDGRYVMTYQSSNVFIRRGDQWKAIASHVSGIKRAPRP